MKKLLSYSPVPMNIYLPLFEKYKSIYLFQTYDLFYMNSLNFTLNKILFIRWKFCGPFRKIYYLVINLDYSVNFD